MKKLLLMLLCVGASLATEDWREKPVPVEWGNAPQVTAKEVFRDEEADGIGMRQDEIEEKEENEELIVVEKIEESKGYEEETKEVNTEDWREKPSKVEEQKIEEKQDDDMEKEAEEQAEEGILEDWREKPDEVKEDDLVKKWPTLDDIKNEPVESTKKIYTDLKNTLYVTLRDMGVKDEIDKIQNIAHMMTKKIKGAEKYDKLAFQVLVGTLAALTVYGGNLARVILVMVMLLIQCPWAATVAGVMTVIGMFTSLTGNKMERQIVKDSSKGIMMMGVILMVMVGVIAQMAWIDAKTQMLVGLGSLFVLLTGSAGYMVSHSNGLSMVPIMAAVGVLMAMAAVTSGIDLKTSLAEVRHGIWSNTMPEEIKKEYLKYKSVQEMLGALGVDLDIKAVVEIEEGATIKEMVRNAGVFTPVGMAQVVQTNKIYHPFLLLQEKTTYAYSLWTLTVGSMVMGFIQAVRALQRDAAISKFYCMARGQAGKDKKDQTLEDVVDQTMRELGWRQVYSVLMFIEAGRVIVATEAFIMGWWFDGMAMGMINVGCFAIGFMLIGPTIWVKVVGRAWILSGRAAKNDAELALMIDVPTTGCTDPYAEAKSLIYGGPILGTVLIAMGMMNSTGLWISVASVLIVIAIAVHSEGREQSNVGMTIMIAMSTGFYSQLFMAYLDWKTGSKTDYWLKTRKPLRGQ